MTDLTSKEKFAEAFSAVDATNEPAEIRRLIDADDHKELCQSQSGKTYMVVNGELMQVEG